MKVKKETLHYEFLKFRVWLAAIIVVSLVAVVPMSNTVAYTGVDVQSSPLFQYTLDNAIKELESNIIMPDEGKNRAYCDVDQERPHDNRIYIAQPTTDPTCSTCFGTTCDYTFCPGTYTCDATCIGPTCEGPPTCCTYSINPANQSFSASGGSGSVSVVTQGGCFWSAISHVSWITIISGSSGSGNGTVSYQVSEYAGTSQRTGTMTIAGKTFTVMQEGIPSCQYLLPDGSFENGPPPASAWTEWRNVGSGSMILDPASIFSISAYDGTYAFWAGGYSGSPVSNYVEQTLDIPTGVEELVFWTVFWRPSADDPANNDVFSVSINGAPVFTKNMVRANDTYPDWVEQGIDISSYAGQTITLRFEATSTGTLTGNVLVDYVNVFPCMHNDIIVDFGASYGIWVRYDDTSWKMLHGLNPGIITVGDVDSNGIDDLIIDFVVPNNTSLNGIWVKYDNGTWEHIHGLNAEAIAVGDVDGNGIHDVIIDFGASYGIWVRYDDTSWKMLHGLNPEIIAAGDVDGNGIDDLIIDFVVPNNTSLNGIWVKYDNGTWEHIHGLNAEAIAVGDVDGNGIHDVIIDFGAFYGIWVRYDNGTWKMLHGLNPEIMTVGDVDGNEYDDLIIDFGAPVGIWVRYDDGTWENIHGLNTEAIAAGDIDGNGIDDLIIDFVVPNNNSLNGIWVRYDNGTWKHIHGLNCEIMAVGDVD